MERSYRFSIVYHHQFTHNEKQKSKSDLYCDLLIVVSMCPKQRDRKNHGACCNGTTPSCDVLTVSFRYLMFRLDDNDECLSLYTKIPRLEIQRSIWVARQCEGFRSVGAHPASSVRTSYLKPCGWTNESPLFGLLKGKVAGEG